MSVTLIDLAKRFSLEVMSVYTPTSHTEEACGPMDSRTWSYQTVLIFVSLSDG